MKHAEICPICKGRGRVPEDPEWDSGPFPGTRVCHGCDGKGWVEVEGECGQPIRPWPIWTATDAESFDDDASSSTLHTCVKINPEYLSGLIHG